MSIRPRAAAVAVGTAALLVPAYVAADRSADALAGPPPKVPSYEVSHLDSLGGNTSAGSSINAQDLIAGFSHLPDGQTMHATVWQDEEIEDLGTLGGPNSAVLWPGRNKQLVVGVAETAEDNPLGENWSCSAFFPGEPTQKTCLGFVWESGDMRSLPTLGGHNGFAADVNRLGQVVGWAENEVEDPTCTSPQVLQFRAVVWGPGEGEIEELPPYPGDSVSAATAINRRGQVVGISGDCDNAVGRFTAKHAVLWEDGNVIDLGNLGGEAWHTPMSINRHGEVVGFSNPTGVVGGAFKPKAFRWTEAEGMIDLGTLSGDTTSQALGIDGRGRIVGVSCLSGACKAVTWRGDDPVDLNQLVSGDEGELTSANDIRKGVITGTAVAKATGETVAYEATRDRAGRPSK